MRWRVQHTMGSVSNKAEQPSVARFPDLAGKRALVTGGSAGIGRAVALALAAEGVTVTVMARRQERLDAVIQDMSCKGCAVVGDLANLDDCTRAVETAISLMGGLDLVINNGAPSTEEQIKHAEEPAGFEAAFRLHVSSAFAIIKAAEAELIKNKGAVVNVSSMAGKQSGDWPLMYPYNVAKAAQDQLTRCLARKYAPLGVRINGVNPAWVSTEAVPLAASILQASEEDFVEAAGKLHAMQRISSPEEQAAVIVFLCSGAASFITGSNIKVDGGMALMRGGFPQIKPPASEAAS